MYDDGPSSSMTPSPISSNRSLINNSGDLKVELEQSDEEFIIKNEPEIEPEWSNTQIALNHTERPHSYTCDKCLHR